MHALEDPRFVQLLLCCLGLMGTVLGVGVTWFITKNWADAKLKRELDAQRKVYQTRQTADRNAHSGALHLQVESAARAAAEEVRAHYEAILEEVRQAADEDEAERLTLLRQNEMLRRTVRRLKREPAAIIAEFLKQSAAVTAPAALSQDIARLRETVQGLAAEVALLREDRGTAKMEFSFHPAVHADGRKKAQVTPTGSHGLTAVRPVGHG